MGVKRFRVVLLCLLLGGCQAGYYAHLAKGQFQLLTARQPIADLLAGEGTDPALKPRLQAALDARAFAVSALGLPNNGSYTQYADLGRPYVLWNVFATPEFSLAPQEWCHLGLGCMAYRGYYDRALADEEAARLRAQGFDVEVSGVPAYSTLGWFDDPLLNSMLHWPDDQLAGTIFHELAHQQVFVSGDTAFNESFATFVEDEGLRQYLRAEPQRWHAVSAVHERQQQFVALMLDSRRRLEALYAEKLSPPEMRAGKHAEFARLRAAYEELKRTEWDGDGRYDGWMARDLNNARLLPYGLYHQWVPAFAALFRDSAENWTAFYRAAAELADRPAEQRLAALEALGTSTALLR